MNPSTTLTNGAARAGVATNGQPGYPAQRPRRMRINPTVRRMVRETSLSVSDLIYPMFVRHGRNQRVPIGSMPGQHQFSVDQLAGEARALARAGIPREPWEGPQDYAARVARERPEHAAAVRAAADAYALARYGRDDPQALAALVVATRRRTH